MQCLNFLLLIMWLPEHRLVEIFPEVLSHQSEGTEEGPAKGVKICVPVIRVLTEPLQNKYYIVKVPENSRKETGWKCSKFWRVGIQWGWWEIPRGRRNPPDRDQPHWSCHTAGSSSSPPSCTSSCGCCWTAPTPGGPPPKTRCPFRWPGWSS